MTGWGNILGSIVIQLQTRGSGKSHPQACPLDAGEKHSKALKLRITSGSWHYILVYLVLKRSTGHGNGKQLTEGVIKKTLSHMLQMFLL